MGFNPEMLIIAREARGLSQTELAERAGVRQGTISKAEGGILIPSPDLLNDLSMVLEFSTELFDQPDRIYGFNSTVFFHRKRHSLPDRVLRKLHAHMNLTRMRISRLLRAYPLSSQFRFSRTPPGEYEGGVVALARITRAAWMLPPGPIRNVTEVIETSGGIVVPFDFGTRQADAISEWIEGYPPIFLINTNLDVPGDRMRLTLAHEIGHIIMHEGPGANIEEEANLFGAEFLMPRREIRGALYTLNMQKLADHKRHWKVSMAALIQRAFELKTITDAQRRYLFINLTRRSGTRLHEPFEGDIPREQPRLFGRIVRQHLTELGFSILELSKMLFFGNEDEFRIEILGERSLKLV